MFQAGASDYASRSIHDTQNKTIRNQHILHNQHKYGSMDKTMTLLKPLNNTSLLTPTNSSLSILSIKKGSSSLNKTQASRTQYSS